MHLLASTANLCRSAYVAIMNVQKPPRVGPLNDGAMLGWLVWRSGDAIIHHPWAFGRKRRMSCVALKVECLCLFFLLYIFVRFGGTFSIMKKTCFRLLGWRTYSKCYELDLPHGEPVCHEGLGRLELRCGLVHDIIRPTEMSSKNLPNPHFQP